MSLSFDSSDDSSDDEYFSRNKAKTLTDFSFNQKQSAFNKINNNDEIEIEEEDEEEIFFKNKSKSLNINKKKYRDNSDRSDSDNRPDIFLSKNNKSTKNYGGESSSGGKKKKSVLIIEEEQENKRYNDDIVLEEDDEEEIELELDSDEEEIEEDERDEIINKKKKNKDVTNPFYFFNNIQEKTQYDNHENQVFKKVVGEYPNKREKDSFEVLKTSKSNFQIFMEFVDKLFKYRYYEEEIEDGLLEGFEYKRVDKLNENMFTSVMNYFEKSIYLLRIKPYCLYQNMPLSLVESKEVPITSIEWGHHKKILAIAKIDNTIDIYDLDTSSEPENTLVHEYQKDINCMKWNPVCNKTLAVGCRFGVCLWDSNSWMEFLHTKNHFPVTSIEWSHNGDYFVTGSINDDAIVVWDFTTNKPTALKRIGFCCNLKFSPNGYYLFAAYTNGTIRIWETMNWTCEKWENNPKKISRSAVWSSDSKYLLMNIDDEDELLCFQFHYRTPTINASLTSSILLPEYSINNAKETFCGDIKDLIWDDSGTRLAISFKSSNRVAILITTLIENQDFQFRPHKYISPPKNINCKPIHLNFRPNSIQPLLCIAWSEGTITLHRL